MRRNGFWSGLLLGGLLGAMIGLTSYSNLGAEAKNRISQAQKKMEKAKILISTMWRQLLKA